MPDTFGGEWHRPRRDGVGRSQRDLQDRASFDHESQSGCGALLLLCVLAVAALVGMVIT
jgi:hypothetical protein